MTQQPLSMPEQLDRLITGRQRCLDARESRQTLQDQIDALRGERDEQLIELDQRSLSAHRIGRERLAAALRTDHEQLSREFEKSQQQVQQELESELDALLHDHDQSIAECERRLESELWVLQSVCDETSDDSPVGRLERAREAFLTQQQVLTERFSVLAENTTRTVQFLTACHAEPDLEPPPPDIKPASGDAARQQAVDEVEQGTAAISALGRLQLPHWVYGFRIGLLLVSMFLILLVGVTAVRADLRNFINSDVSREDWRWLGISAVISLVSSAFTCLILLMIVQQRLRNGFAELLQHTSNARACEHHWIRRTETALQRQQAAADEWQKEMQQEREQRVGRMRAATEQRIAAIQSQYAGDVAVTEGRFREQLAQLHAAHQQRVAARNESFESDRATATRHEADQLEAERKQINEMIGQRTARLTEQLRLLTEDWSRDQADLVALARTSRDAAGGLSRWPANHDHSWKVPPTIPPVVVVGDVLTSLPSPPRANEVQPVTLTLDFPALLRFPQDMAIAVEHDSAGREPALDFVRALLLRLLTTVPPGRLQFTLIDPIGLGQSFSAMMHLADFDELLISNRIWTESTQIREQLQKVTEHMENVFQTYLRSEFDTIEQYNLAAGEVAEPYHFVVVAGFPAGFSDESARHLTSILTSGPRCGVYAIVLSQAGQPVPRGFDQADLIHHSCWFTTVAGRVLPLVNSQPVRPEGGIEFESLRAPSGTDAVRIVRIVGDQSRTARRVEVSFTRIAPKSDDLWTHSTADGIDIPIGRSGAARLQYMRLGRGTSQHVLVAGKTGSGKSTLLHILITNLAMHYSPQEIEFYLIDFKKGVEFRTYAAHHLPHARVVAIESDREFGLSVLERLDEILQERGELFRTRGVQDLPAFRRQYPSEPMPRLLLLIDEFQEFFVAEDRVSSRAALLLDRLIRQGRAFGMHVLLGSQTLGGAYSLARSTLGQVAVRIALQCSESDAHLILSEDNSAARLLSRPGEAIYNDANGLQEGNHPFQIAWLEEDQRETIMRDLRRRRAAGTPVSHRMVVFEGNVPPSADLCQPLHEWLAAPASIASGETDTATAWLGEPVAIAEPTRVTLRRAGGQNLLIIGQEAEMADSLLLLFSVCHSLAMRRDQPSITEPAVHFLHDGRDRDSLNRMQSVFGNHRWPGCQLYVAAEADELIRSLHELLVRRETESDLAELPPQLLIIRNIGQFRSLRREDEEFSFGGFGEAKAETAATRLGDLIKRGPLVGLHVVVWSDSYSNAVRWLTTSLLREFEDRVAFRMNATDSASLIDSPAASAMTPGRAILYRDQTGAIEKFRPFAWPSAVWLDQWLARNADDDTATDQDIDTLTIE